MRNFAPQTKQFNERAITRVQGDIEGAPDFSAGVFKDLPGSSVPANGLADSHNYRIFAKYASIRPGTKRWSNTTLPAIETGYSITKTGETVTSTVGTNFTPSMIDDWIVYDDGGHERISAYICATQVKVDSSTVRAASTAAWTHGSLYGIDFHKKQRKIVMHIGDRIYVARNLRMSAWDRCWMRGTNATPARSLSQFDEMENYFIIFNANGPLKLDLSKVEPVFWKINSAIPTVLITNIAETATSQYGYKYNYGMSVVSGTDVTRQQNTSGLTIEQKSGPTAVNSDYKDYGTDYTTRPVGRGETTFGILTGGALGTSWDTSAEWKLVTDGQFAITLNGTARNIECDFGDAASMEDVAGVIETGIRRYVSDATCKFITNHLVITLPSEGSTVTVTTAGTAGTDIGLGHMSCQAGANPDAGGGGSATVTNSVFTLYNAVSAFTYPTDGGAWTHYEVNRSFDIGPNGIDPLSGLANNKELFVWNRSHPVAKAFVAQAVLGVVTAYEGTFEEEDNFNTLVFADGTSQAIGTYTDSTHVVLSFAVNVARQACAIGGGSVAMAAQVNGTVTRTAGGTFAATDVGKILFWANGDWTVIKSYTNANVVEATLPQTGSSIASTAVTWSPVSMVMTDITRDDYFGTDTTVKQLRPRTGGYSLKNRFHVPIPDCDSGIVAGAFIIGSIRAEQKTYYSQILAFETYYGGYYNQENQVILFNDTIELVREFPDDAILYCTNSIHRIPINTFNTVEIPEVGEIIAVLAGQAQVVNEVGLKLIGTLRRTGQAKDGFIASDYSYREFTYSGGQYSLSPNIAYNRYHKDFKKIIEKTGASSYDKINGHIIGGNDTEDTTSFTIYRETAATGLLLRETDNDGTLYREVA